MIACKGWAGRIAVLSALSIAVAYVVFRYLNPTDEQEYLNQFRKGLDTIECSLMVADYELAVRQFVKLRAIPLTSIPLIDEVRFWRCLNKTGFETEDFEVAIQSVVATLGLDWDEQDMRVFQPFIPLAHALKKAGDTTKAIEWYILALANVPEPSRVDVTSNLAGLYAGTGKYHVALAYCDESKLLNRLRGVTDPVSVAWMHMLRARSYGGLRMYGRAENQLDSALTILANQKRDREAYSQKDVRISLYRSLWRDSLALRRMGASWHRIEREFHSLHRRDSMELEALGVSRVRRHYKHVLRRLIPRYLSDSYHRVPEHLDSAMITSITIDGRGWKWVGTLRGLYIDIGGTLVPVETMPYLDSHRPVRSLAANEQVLQIGRYDGTTDTLSWANLIGRAPSQKNNLLPSVTFSWIPWIGSVPSGIVGVQDTSKLLYFFGDRYGYGTLRHGPQELAPMRIGGRIWKGVVSCGYRLSTDTILVGTDHGLWIFTPSSSQIRRVVLAPDYPNKAEITSIGVLTNSSIRVTIPFFNPVVFDSLTITPGLLVRGRPEEEPYQYESSLTAANPIVTYLHGINSSKSRTLVNLPAPLYSIPLPEYRVWAWGNVTYLHDVLEKSFTIHTIPPVIPTDTALSLASFGISNNIIGVISPRGLLVASVSKTNRGPGQRTVCYRTPTMTHFKVASEGAAFELRDAYRDLEVICGRPFSWGTTSIRQSFSLPWSGQHVASRTNRIEYIRNIPVGEHHLNIRSDDRHEPIQMVITVTPSIMETAWFRAGVVILFFGLLTGSIRYVLLTQQHRRDAQQRLRNAERLQIGQDVHDAVGADLVRISIVARADPSPSNNREISRLCLEASRTLRDIIWSVSDSHTLDAVLAITVERVRAMSEEAGMGLVVHIPTEIPSRIVTPQASRDTVLIVTESMTNVIKHSRARTIRYEVAYDEHQLTLTLIDDGIGYDVERVSVGVGIKSIRRRAERSGLGLYMQSACNDGTRVIITIPLDIT